MKKKSDAEMMRAVAEMSRLFDNGEQEKLLMAMAGVFKKTDEEIELLFEGKDSCPPEEEEIIVSDLSFEEKMVKLRVLRGNVIVPKKFKKLATDDDAIRAKAWGVKLD